MIVRAITAAGVALWALSGHARDIHDGPVAVRPMVTAPSLIGKTPPRPKIERCVDERSQLREILEAALNDTDYNRGTPAQIRARYRDADKALAASTNIMDAARKPTDCDDAAEAASEYVLGEGR
jgi:hypothetical protein